MRAHATIAEYVDIGAQQVFEVLLKSDEIKQITAGLHLDEQVNIAGRLSLASGNRAEHADVARTVISRTCQDLHPSGTESFEVDRYRRGHTRDQLAATRTDAPA